MARSCAVAIGNRRLVVIKNVQTVIFGPKSKIAKPKIEKQKTPKLKIEKPKIEKPKIRKFRNRKIAKSQKVPISKLAKLGPPRKAGLEITKNCLVEMKNHGSAGGKPWWRWYSNSQ